MSSPSTDAALALRPREAAKALGVSERWLWQATKDGIIPCVRMRRAVMYPVSELTAWLTTQATANGGAEQ
jgi:excisionase family DNA binding protein